ncbi:hypothetical protein TELCIR_16854 [Teladorsagia circumcincta]|uniref:Uncharacterized protein n=1 Tax=Teladorsagia circumcincta TaxID=45464 RepID=A0A2G9TUL2_TELCI|nr:hypothetical protein TELCIR_16854 [Teladorsagia circumcincta]
MSQSTKREAMGSPSDCGHVFALHRQWIELVQHQRLPTVRHFCSVHAASLLRGVFTNHNGRNIRLSNRRSFYYIAGLDHTEVVATESVDE